MEEIEVNLEQFTSEHLSQHISSRPLPDATVAEIIDYPRQEADRHWFIDAECSLEFAIYYRQWKNLQ